MVEHTLALIQRNANGDSQKLSLESVPAPKPEKHQLLIKVSHVAQNPTNVQAFDTNAFGDGTVLGCDFVGTVEEKGEDAVRAEKGDIIAGLIWGGEIKGLGAYSQYTLADEKISFKVPPSVSLADAATVPLAVATAWLAFFSSDCLHIGRNGGKDVAIVIWGGSSSVGQYAVQLAALHGFRVITTCSPRHFDRVKSLGADHVFDYKSPDVVTSIRNAAQDVQYVFDTIGNTDSSPIASQTLRDEGGVLCTVRPGKANTAKVTERTKVTDVLVWTAFLKDHKYREFFWPANKSDHELATELFQKLPAWLEKENIKPNEPKVLKGLESVDQGFQEHREGKISGYKIVYEVGGEK